MLYHIHQNAFELLFHLELLTIMTSDISSLCGERKSTPLIVLSCTAVGVIDTGSTVDISVAVATPNGLITPIVTGDLYPSITEKP